MSMFGVFLDVTQRSAALPIVTVDWTEGQKTHRTSTA